MTADIEAVKAILAPAVEEVAKTPLACPDCGQTYKPTAGHCRGGRYGGCCKSFQTSACFDRHRTGDFGIVNTRRCMTTEEMVAAGWDVDSRSGHWMSPKAVLDRGYRKTNPLPGIKAVSE